MSKAWTLEGECELRHFLKVARPKWSRPRQNGPRDIDRVIAKLRAIGVSDTETLLQRIYHNCLNSDLAAKGLPPLRPEAIESIRKQGPFMKTLEHIDAPHVRQTGLHAPVPQLLSSRWLLDPKPAVVPLNHSLGMSFTHADGFGRKISSFDGYDSEGALSVGSSEAPLSAMYSLRLRGSHARTRARAKRGCNKPQSNGSLPMVPDATSGSKIAMNSSSSSRLLVPSSPPMHGQGLKLSQSESLPQMHASVLNSSAQNFQSLINAKVCTSSWIQHTRSPRMGEDDHQLIRKQMEKLQRVGAAMTNSKRGARWSATSSKGALTLGEEMLAEQQALDHRAEIKRLALSHDESFRSHVSSNIRSRIKHEVKSQSLQAINLRQKCTNVNRSLDAMRTLRRELGNLKSQMEVINNDSDSKFESMAKDLVIGYENRTRKHSVADSVEGAIRRDSMVSDVCKNSNHGKAMNTEVPCAQMIQVHVTPGEEQALQL